MAEVVGTVSSIITLLSLSQKTLGYLRDVKDTTGDRNRLKLELRSIQGVLETLKETVEEVQAEDDNSWAASLGALGREQGPLEQLKDAILEIENIIQNTDSDKPATKLTRRLLFPFRTKDINKLLDIIQRQKGILMLAIERDHLALSQAILRNVQSVVVKWETAHEEKARDGLLRWLTTVDYSLTQTELARRRQAATGQWLLDSAEYCDWVQKTQGTLFCPGIPGAGKTMMTAIVVADLAERMGQDESVGLAYVYCDFQRQGEQAHADLLASLLKQLLIICRRVPDGVESLYEAHEGEKTRATAGQLQSSLLTTVALFSRVFFVIDGLDECEPSNRSKFLSDIFDIQSTLPVNIFATSRFIPEISRLFSEAERLEIRADEDDVRKYIRGNIANLHACVQGNTSLQEEIISTISKAADGMFLLARLYFNMLRYQLTPRGIRTTMANFRKQGSTEQEKVSVLGNIYAEQMQRIQTQPAAFRRVAYQTLSWLIFARRPLSTLEMRHALATEIGDTELDADNLPQIEDVVSVCLGLVTVDEANNVIRLVHYTAREYFNLTCGYWFPTANAYLASICCTYLLFETFRDEPYLEPDQYQERLRLNPLYLYAAYNWPFHARGSQNPQLTRFLESHGQAEAASQPLILGWERWLWRLTEYHLPSDCPSRGMSGLHLVAYFGIDYMVQRLVDRDGPNCQDGTGRTPLSWASENGHDTVVSLLFASKIALEQHRDDCDATPLEYAALGGHVSVVAILLANGAMTEYETAAERTELLSCVASKGQVPALKLLLEVCGNEVNSHDCNGMTPLLTAAKHGHEEVVELLLSTSTVDADVKTGVVWLDIWARGGSDNSSIDSKNNLIPVKFDSLRTPLSLAAENGHENIVKMLLGSTAVNPDSRDFRGRIPLSYAAENGHDSIARLFLDTKRVSSDLQTLELDRDGHTPLSLAAENGHDTVALHLLATNKFDINSRTTGDPVCAGRTPLLLAAYNGHKAIVKLLLQAGVVAMENVGGGNGSSHLLEANRPENSDGVRPCLADPLTAHKLDTRDEQGRTAISLVAEKGHVEAMSLLLGEGFISDSKDINGCTPLFHAVRCGHSDAVELLLEHGANANTRDNHGRTPLDYVPVGGLGVAKCLVRFGANINARDNNGLSPLSHLAWSIQDRHPRLKRGDPVAYASSKAPGHTIQWLLGKGADANCKDKFGWTPLAYAAATGSAYATSILIKNGADVGLKGGNGQTPLSLVASGSRAIVMGEGDSTLQDSPVALEHCKPDPVTTMKLLLNARAAVDSRDCHLRTPLSHAAEHRDKKMVEILLDHGAEVDARDINDRTPLSYAAKGGETAVAELLLKQGADVDSRDSHLRTPLSHAAEIYDEEMVKVLLDHGAEIDTRDINHRTPLSYAMKYGETAVAELLLKQGANVDSHDSHLRTPLSHAAENDYEEMVEFLLDDGAEVDRRDMSDRTPLCYAAEYGGTAVVELLLKRGANVDSRDSYRRTPLSYAAEKRHKRIVKILLDNGAEVDARDINDRTPLSYANPGSPMALLLIAKGAREDNGLTAVGSESAR